MYLPQWWALIKAYERWERKDKYALQAIYSGIYPRHLLEKVVVGANNAEPKEIITHEKDGFLFEPDNPDDLEKKAIMAWENPELGKNGYEKVKEKYDWRVVIKQIDKVYENVLEK